MLEENYIATRTWRVTPDPICILDRDGRFVAVNPAWISALGWNPEETVGESYLKFLHPDDVDRSIEAFSEVLTGKPVLRFENRYRRKDGGYIWFSWNAVPEGEQFFCTVRDITEEKMRVQTILDQQAEAELREQFLAILGHDLRNPLSSMISGIRLLSRSAQDDRNARVLQGMKASSGRMSELIQNMMDFARVRLGDGIGLERLAHSDLDQQIVEVVDEIRNTYPHANIEIDTALDGEIDCDAPRIMQVLSNLVGNSVTHGLPGEPIQITARNSDNRLIITVANTGEEIPEAARENLFQPFFKGDSRNSPHGLGLGLYISAQIAEAHGGELSAKSDADLTSFELNIPV